MNAKSRWTTVMLLALAGVIAGVGAGQAAITTAPLNVSANVTAGACSIDAPGLTFGNITFPILDSGVSTTSGFSVVCPAGFFYQIDLNQGLHFASGSRNLQLAGAGNLAYNLYTDPGHTQIFGSTAGGAIIASTGTGSPQPVTVYGFIPTQGAPPGQGQFTDTVTITLSF